MPRKPVFTICLGQQKVFWNFDSALRRMTSFRGAETLAICDGWDEGVWQPSCGTRLGLPRHGKGFCLPRLYPSLQLTWALDGIRSQQ